MSDIALQKLRQIAADQTLRLEDRVVLQAILRGDQKMRAGLVEAKLDGLIRRLRTVR